MRPLDPRLLAHLRPARPALLRVVGAGTVGGLLTVAQAFAIGTLVVELVSRPGGDGWHPAAAWLALVVALRALSGYVVDVSSAVAAGQVSVALRRRLLDAVTRVDADDLETRRTGEVTLLATRGTTAIEPYLTRYLPSLVGAAVLPAATLVAVFALDWLSGLIVLFTLPLVPVFAILIGLATRDRAQRQWRELAVLSGHFLDVVRGLPTLVAHRRARAQSSRIREVTERYRLATVDTLKLAFASSVALELIATLSVALVAVSVGLRLAVGSLDFRTALVVLLLAPEAYWPLRRMGAEFHAAAEGVAAFEAADAFLAPAPGRPGPLPARPVLSGDLQVRHLTAGYGERVVLDELSATFASPGLTAVVGPSGCGKSTLLATLLGEHRASAGVVQVGGRDLADVDAAHWRSLVAWAPQRPWLTAGSIADNVRIGRPGAEDAEVWEALRRVDLDATVAALPEGMDTLLGEDGAGLSAGQRARVALARVVLSARPFVLLDEPTAHLDETTEAVFLETLRWLAGRATVIVVAHRAAVAAAADRVVTLPAPPTVSPPVLDAVADSTPRPRDAGGTAPVDEPPAPRPGRWGRRTGILLGALSSASGVALTATAAWLITRASGHPQVLVLMVAIVGVRTFGLARPAFRYAERIVSHDAALRLLAERRARVYDALVPLVPGRLGPRRGDVLTSVVDDVDAVVDQQLRVRQPVWTAVLVGCGATALAALATPVGGGVVAGVLALTAVAALLARHRAAAAEPDFVRLRAALSTEAESIVHGARQLDLWGATGAALEQVSHTGERLAGASVRTARGLASGRALVVVATGAGLLGVAALVPSGTVSPAMLALLVLLPLALVDALLPAVDAGALAPRVEAARGRLDALTALAPTVTDPERPTNLPTRPVAAVLDGVSAGWGERDAVRDLHLDVRPGSRVGVVGVSGSGKSTLAALLMRFLDPHSGSVRLGGTDVRDLSLDDVRCVVGLVDDDPYVFGSSVVENIRLARPDADDGAVERALRAAHLGPWLDALPRGLHTRVGEGGALVSGGERARIGVARLLLADPDVWVLDEPTAHLDTATASAVAEEVLAAGTGRGLVWITHGTVGLAEMDQVVRLSGRPGPAGEETPQDQLKVGTALRTVVL